MQSWLASRLPGTHSENYWTEASDRKIRVHPQNNSPLTVNSCEVKALNNSPAPDGQTRAGNVIEGNDFLAFDRSLEGWGTYNDTSLIIWMRFTDTFTDDWLVYVKGGN